MIEGRVRHALELFSQAQEAQGYATTDPRMLDEMAVFCSAFPEGAYEDFWAWHMERLSTALDRKASYAGS